MTSVRKTRNLWKYVSVSCEIAPHGSPKDETGMYVKVGFGRSPRQARFNAKCVSGHNVNGVPVLGDSVFFLNGKEMIREKYSDNLIKSDGSY